MQILLLFSLIMILSNCTSIEIAKEVTKASKSINTSVNNIVKSSDNESQEEIIEVKINDKTIIDQEIANLEIEKKEKQEIIKEQKKKTKINFIGKTFKEIKLIFGVPELIRVDGNSRILRFDNNFCRLFLFSNTQTKNAEIEYFEVRNKKGELIINREKIEKCYKNFRLI